MRIAIFSDNFYPEISGIRDSIEALGKELGRRGHYVTFYVPKYSPQDYTLISRPIEELNLGERVSIVRFASVHFPSPTRQSRAVIPSVLRWMQVRTFKPDLIHSQTYFGVGWDAWLSAKLLRVPLIGTNHTAIHSFKNYIPFPIEWFIGYVVWYYNQCNFVSAPSQSVFADIGEKRFLRPHRVISNPIDLVNYTSVAAPAISEVKKQYGLSDATLVYAGRLADEKNIDVVIRAVARVAPRIPSVIFAIAGHGSAEEKLKKLASNLGVAPHVRWLGTLPKKELADLFRASEIFVTMSTSETQCMVLLQAMGCGIPVLGARAGALPEYINEQTGFLLEPGDDKGLSEKIIFLLQDTPLRSDLGRRAERVVTNFSVPSVTSIWEQVYTNVLSHGK